MALSLTAALAAVVVPLSTAPKPADAGGQRFDLTRWTDPRGHGHVVRWDPCTTVTYAVNVDLAGRTPSARGGALADARKAMDRAAARTGMSFRYVGTTHEVPRDGGGTGWAERQSAAEIVIAWVTPETSNLLSQVGSSYASGTGGWMWKAWTTPSGAWRLAIGRGFVVINAKQNGDYAKGFGSGTTRGALLLHEIGHALGLNHVGNTNELMYPTMLNRRSSRYKNGDEDGLTRLGRHAGCIGVTDSIWRPLPR